jgi:predicted transcriptional regulator of viral defense system
MHDLAALLGPTRTSSSAALSAVVNPRTIARWLTSGRLVRLHPGWVTVPEFADDWTVRAHAATGYAGGLLSHMSALAVHRMVDTEVTRLNVTVSDQRRVRTSRWLRIHRSRIPFEVVNARALPATTVARSLIDTWADAHRARAKHGFDGVVRAAVLRATRERRGGRSSAPA